ncbi:hypothetical protein ACQP2T_19010 [Nonomuraea sp. CA-143628]|uniref:hypothetical protein n=1 Tax=Nonomuraea sp. CA-143628 TaxID=3239997 RepID=UPI003D9185FF
MSDATDLYTIGQLVLSGRQDNRLEFGLNLRPLVLEHAAAALEKGIPPDPPAVPAFQWLLTALRTHR